MKISGKEIAQIILKNLKLEIKKEKLKPSLAIILAGDNPASKIYVNHKIKAAKEIGVNAKLYEFSEKNLKICEHTLNELNKDKNIHGIIIQYPVFKSWDFDKLVSKVNPKKDVDGFLEKSPFLGATALGVWEMLSSFAKHEGFKKAEEFLKDKKVVILGKGKTAGGPTIKLLKGKWIEFRIIDSKTEDPNEIIKNADVVISATGKKNIINGKNIKKGIYVIGVGVGKDEEKIYGDINEEEVSKKAKLYCPTIGGIGPLTIACLLRNVVEAAR